MHNRKAQIALFAGPELHASVPTVVSVGSEGFLCNPYSCWFIRVFLAEVSGARVLSWAGSGWRVRRTFECSADSEFIQFFKNVCIMGGLCAYICQLS